ncbi:3-oxoacyl-ACP synthase [Protofrankia sp. BMG5.30]|uniref:3-oxoacyl-ACP synthase n=1 Tax=Protofrankia coriariae TaxID=1562887 RepID=A0ABR5F6F4_9ACTN|nr:3-oxoacyl-ACP synthase [Protofrankia coriariae]ONH37584.1 3-oxoacyl-ACP synthase [Protofrankia sp. BMG5.30]
MISAYTAVSPYGVGRAAFDDGVRAGRPATGALGEAWLPGPYAVAGLIPGFTAAGALGNKGTRSMDRATAIAVTTVRELIIEAGAAVTGQPEQVGLVLGTGHGSVQSIMDFTRDSLTGEKPYHVDPAQFPNTVMNRAAGQSAIWHGIRGPNTTISGGWLTGLLALSYAARIYRAGRCARALCGSVEEYSRQRAWLEFHARGGVSGTGALGEGGAAVLLESARGATEAGRTPLAAVLAIRFGAFGAPADAGTALAGCVRGALASAGAAPESVRIVSGVDDGGEFGAVERAAVRDALGGDGARWVSCRRLIGDTSAAATSFQLATALAVAEPGDLALVTGVDPDGATVGCALLSVARS